MKEPEYLTCHDALTGLSNRALLTEGLQRAIDQAIHANQWVAVCYLNLDNFEPINDSYGWTLGDALLLALGRSIQLGVDIEQLRPRPRARELAIRFFHPDEVRWLLSLPGDGLEAAFVRLWCAKEAMLKAHGKGISFGLEKLAFAERDQGLELVACDSALGAPAEWTLREWSPLAGYRAALAWRPLLPARQTP